MSALTIPLPHGTQHDLARRGLAVAGERGHDAMGIWAADQLLRFFLAYADDTALVASTAERAEQLVALTETTAAHSNLALNWDKCLLLKSHYSRNPVRNLTGEEIKEVERAKYLGVMLSRNGSCRKDVTERLAKARKHFNTLHHFWRRTIGSSVSTTRSLCPCWSMEWSPQPDTGRPSQARVLPLEGTAEDAPHTSHILHEGPGLLTANHF